MSSLQASSQTRLHGATASKRYATVPGTTVRLLTQTSKMPGPSWSLPAHKACPRANGTICDGCYAAKGCYRFEPGLDLRTSFRRPNQALPACSEKCSDNG